MALGRQLEHLGLTTRQRKKA